MMRQAIIYVVLLCLAVTACSRKNKENPYDDWNGTVKGPGIADKPVDPNTIQGLHKNIFKPTCANSGCHDGNFEPDFRSIESSYNSLVGRNVTNLDPANPQYKRRVEPGDPGSSMLLHRILNFIPGTQGKMPLSTDPGSDWPSKKDEYIQNIQKWISDGANDQAGNSPSATDFIPQAAGMLVFADGSGTPLTRTGYNPVILPAGTMNVRIMVAYTDDKTPVQQFGNTNINFSLNPRSYDSTVSAMVKESQSFSGTGIMGTAVVYWHSITLPVSELGTTGDVVWVRTETSDNVNGNIYIPSSLSSFNTKKYFAIKLE